MVLSVAFPPFFQKADFKNPDHHQGLLSLLFDALEDGGDNNTYMSKGEATKSNSEH
jgi:hypothetical protein